MDKTLLIAGCALLAFALFGGGGESNVAHPGEGAAAPALSVVDPEPRAGNGTARFTATRAPDGHFYADVRVNGATVRMLVDTGASAVVLSRDDARRAGIQAGPGEFTATARTAGGEIALKPVTIDRMAIGPIESRNVPAMVAEAELPVSLVGQSFLQRVGTVEISANEMRLR